MPDPFTIRIFVPDGDPEGVRLIDRMNWTGLGIVFPRSKWMDVRQRSEFTRAGVYILVGYQEDDLPTIYIGQADGVRNRIENHYQNKDFWDWGIIFVSNSGGLNRAHVTWLEYALVNRATATGRCRLDNSNAPPRAGSYRGRESGYSGILERDFSDSPSRGTPSFRISEGGGDAEDFDYYPAAEATVPPTRYHHRPCTERRL